MHSTQRRVRSIKWWEIRDATVFPCPQSILCINEPEDCGHGSRVPDANRCFGVRNVYIHRILSSPNPASSHFRVIPRSASHTASAPRCNYPTSPLDVMVSAHRSANTSQSLDATFSRNPIVGQSRDQFYSSCHTFRKQLF